MAIQSSFVDSAPVATQITVQGRYTTAFKKFHFDTPGTFENVNVNDVSMITVPS